jgi:predicted nucleic acid-binding protein
MYLGDSNVWLDVLLQRPRAPEVQNFLARVPPSQTFISSFSIHTIGILLVNSGRGDAFKVFLQHALLSNGVSVLTINPLELGSLADLRAAHRLDFDDAYQYALADRHGLTLISYDADFDRTPRGRKTPVAALAPKTP